MTPTPNTTPAFDRLTADDAHALQAVMAAGALGLRAWRSSLPDSLRPALDALDAQGLIRPSITHEDDRAYEVSDAGFALLASAPWWNAPWFVPDSPGWLTDAWFAANILGMTIAVNRAEGASAALADLGAPPFTATAVRRRPDNEWPAVVDLLGSFGGQTSWPSVRWESAVSHADTLIDTHGVSITFPRVRRPDGTLGWGCCISKGDRAVTANGERLTARLREHTFQGTVLCHAAWLAQHAGLLPAAPPSS